MFGILGNTAKSLESIDDRLMQCGLSRRSFLQFCSSLMVAAPFGLAITDHQTPEEVAAGIGKVIRPPVIWLHFQDCTGCTEKLLRPSHPDLGDLILNVISPEYHETLMAGSGKQAEESLRDAIARYAGKYVCVVEGSIPTRDNGVYMKLADRPAMEVLQHVGGKAAAIIAIGSCASMFDTPELRDFSNICRGNLKSLRERCNPALTSRILNGGGTSKYCKVTAAIDKNLMPLGSEQEILTIGVVDAIPYSEHSDCVLLS